MEFSGTTVASLREMVCPGAVRAKTSRAAAAARVATIERVSG